MLNKEPVHVIVLETVVDTVCPRRGCGDNEVELIDSK